MTATIRPGGGRDLRYLFELNAFTWQGVAVAALEQLLDEHEAAVTFSAAACTEEMDSTYWTLTYAHDRLGRELSHELLQRVAAQNGLTPYVYAVEALNKWLAGEPELQKQMEPILRRLGLFGVELGYDPQKDVATSIISAKGPLALARRDSA